MKLTASSRPPRSRAQGEAGFTLTEMVAALLVASMLVAGLAELTRRYATTMTRVRTMEAEARTVAGVRSLMGDLERIDPGSLALSSDRLEARIGDQAITGRILRSPDRTALSWTSPRQQREIDLPVGARFIEAGPRIALGVSGELPLASVEPARDTPFDCQFDTISRTCR